MFKGPIWGICSPLSPKWPISSSATSSTSTCNVFRLAIHSFLLAINFPSEVTGSSTRVVLSQSLSLIAKFNIPFWGLISTSTVYWHLDAMIDSTAVT